MKRTDAQRAFFQGLPVRWRNKEGFGATKWERVSPDGTFRTLRGSTVARPRIFDPDSIYDTGWEIAVGEGYRLIGSAAVEELLETDEFWHSGNREWVTCTPMMFRSGCFYRRKVEEDAPKNKPASEPENEETAMSEDQSEETVEGALMRLAESGVSDEVGDVCRAAEKEIQRLRRLVRAREAGHKSYQPFGVEWEQEFQRMTKADAINILTDVVRGKVVEINRLRDELRQVRTEWAPPVSERGSGSAKMRDNGPATI